MSGLEIGSVVDQDRTLAQKYVEYDVHEADPLASRDSWEQMICAGSQEVLDRKLFGFKSTLSKSQFVSHLLLEQWFINRRLDPLFDSAAEKAYRDGEKGRLEGVEIPNRYHCHMARLWWQERRIRSETGSVVSLDDVLDTYRRNAFMFASCQRIARSYYSYQKSEYEKTPYVPDTRFPDVGTLDICPWLPTPKPGLDSMPHYLWDVKAKQTTQVSTIFERTGILPAYTAISHTWGRYRKNEPSLSIPGVQNWRVPQNYKFDVVHLPEIMQQLPYDYVWLDLLTIPQIENGLSSSSMVDLQRKEIARQATIFQSAATAIAWFNDVHSWDTVRLGLGWGYLAFLQVSGLDDLVKAEVDLNTLLYRPIYADRGRNVEIAEYRDGKVVPNGWFTSLWTLQEICLRPDMLLLNQAFEFLSLTPDQKSLSFSDIISLLYCVPDFSGGPGATKVLMHLLANEARMLNLQTLSRTQILAMGNCRECSNKRRRGEAIMSAIGATEWFTNPTDGKTDLVLGTYPAGLLNELRETIGSGKFFYNPCSQISLKRLLRAFFGSETDKTTLLSRFRIKTREPPKQTDVGIGSLLPIDRDSVCLNWELAHLVYDVSPLTRNWEIELSGKVRIYDAAILSSSLSKTSEEKKDCVIWGMREWKSHGCNIKLNEWLRNFKPETPNYAICLLYHAVGAKVYGVVLKEVTTNVLIKIAVFIQDRDWIQSPVPMTKVNWAVL